AFGVSVTVGGTIGTGILAQPGTIARELPDPRWFLAAWLVGGFYVLLGANSVAELAAMTPRSGGYYVYVRRALGSYPSFVVGWGHWLALGSGAAWITLTLAGYVGILIPPFADFKLTVAMATVVGLALLQWRSVRWSGWVQDWTTLLKGLLFLAVVIA